MGRTNGMCKWRRGWRSDVLRIREGEIMKQPEQPDELPPEAKIAAVTTTDSHLNRNSNVNIAFDIRHFERIWKWWVRDIRGDIDPDTAMQVGPGMAAPKLVLAPMIGQSDLAFRRLCREHGVSLCYTQMYLDEAVCAGEYDEELRLSEVMAIEEEEEKQTILLKIRKQSPPSPRPLPKDGDRNGVVHMKTSDSDDSGDIGHSSIPMRDPGVIDNKQIYDRPLICQIAGNKPETMAAAARHLHELGCVDAVDVNFGCPQRCAQEGNYGSFLLQNDPDLAITIVKAMVAACGGNMPITVKMRVHLEGLQATIATALRFQAAGVSVLCLHGRTNTHSEHEDAADWVAIRAVKMALHIPVIANGSIQSCSDALDCLKYTGADAVMSGTGLLRTPSLFTDFQKRYAASKGKPSNNECMHQATANINSLNCALQEIRDLPNSSELKVGALESTLKPSNDVFNQFKEARNELHEAQATITAEEATGVSARRINTDVATSLRDARRYLTLAEECFKDDLASLEPVPGKHTELAGRYHPAASKVIRDHLLAMLQAHLMDIHMDLWSLLGCAEVCSVRQFRETLNLVEHRLLDSYTSTNNNSVASGNNSNSCISSASATALYSLHQIKFNEFQ